MVCSWVTSLCCLLLYLLDLFILLVVCGLALYPGLWVSDIVDKLGLSLLLILVFWAGSTSVAVTLVLVVLVK
jgi:hypothetical protein